MATYVGLALGDGGISARLVKHFKNENKEWSRFCWFSFDDVVAVRDVTGWSEIEERDPIKELSARTAVRELEALLIMVLGAKDNVNQMKFIAGRPWVQVTVQDCQPGRALTRIDSSWLTDSELTDYLAELER